MPRVRGGQNLTHAHTVAMAHPPMRRQSSLIDLKADASKLSPLWQKLIAEEHQGTGAAEHPPKGAAAPHVGQRGRGCSVHGRARPAGALPFLVHGSSLAGARTCAGTWWLTENEALRRPMHTDAHSVQRTFVHHVYATLARTPYNLDANGAYQATAHTYVACAACVDGVCH